MGFLKQAIEFIGSPTHSRTVGIIIVLFILAIVPLTVVISQQQQELRQRAANHCADTTINECLHDLEVADGNTCSSPQSKCKIGNTIYKCQ